MISGINTSINGLLDASSRVQDAAQRVAASGAVRSSYDASEIEASRPESTTLDLSEQAQQAPQDDTTRALIDQKIATYDFKANLRALKVQDENQKHILDILG